VIVLSSKAGGGGASPKKFSALEMRRALKAKLANHQIPQEMKVVDEIAKNAMGKVNKKSLVREIWGE